MGEIWPIFNVPFPGIITVPRLNWCWLRVCFCSMEEQPANELLNERARRADKIVRNPEKYKICGGCESIIAEKVTICPNCHAYRFISDKNMVIVQAQALGTREPKSVVASDLD